MTTQHNRIMIYSPKADGIDQDGRPAAQSATIPAARPIGSK